MKAMKGKLLKKLKTVKQIGYLRPERILQVKAADGYVVTSTSQTTVLNLQPIPVSGYAEPKKKILFGNVENQNPEVIDAVELMKDLEDKEMEFVEEINDKENIKPELEENNSVILKENHEQVLRSTVNPVNEVLETNKLKTGGCRKAVPLANIDVSSFRGPDLDSSTLFAPDLLQAFEQAVMEVKAEEEATIARIRAKRNETIYQEPPLKTRKTEETHNPLFDFQQKCPPGGDDSVIFYTTGLRGIRKTFEDCRSIRCLLEQFKVLFFERDISMHSEFKEELWEILGGKCLPPRLFIKGRYIGGAEEVLTLHEQGKLRPLLEGIPLDFNGGFCEGCGGVRFIVCFKCNGSRKVADDDEDEDHDAVNESIRFCKQCNENGLLVCPYCC